MRYFRPENLTDAVNWLNDNDAIIAAGCTDLFAMTSSHYLTPDAHSQVLDITAISELDGINIEADHIRIGASTCWSDIIGVELPSAFDGLKLAAREVGSVQIQNSGTVGGNICNASPAADGVPPLLTLNAEVEIYAKSGKRHMPLSQFLLGPRKTSLKSNEILSAIIVPISATKGTSTFLKLGARKYLVISIAMVAIRIVIEGDKIAQICISVGSCSGVAVRMSQLENALAGKSIDNDFSTTIRVQDIARSLSPIDDIRADAGYRIKAAKEIILRALVSLVQNAQGTL